MQDVNLTHDSILLEIEESSAISPWLGEFISKETESHYSRWSFEENRKLLKSATLVLMAITVLFLFVDFKGEGLDWRLGSYLSARVLILAALVSNLYFTTRSSSAKHIDLLTSSLSLSIAVSVISIDASRPVDFFAHIGVDVSTLLCGYVVMPARMKLKIALGAGLSTSLLLLVYGFKDPVHDITYASYTSSIIIANMLGAWIAVQSGRVRRQSYMQLLQERQARSAIRTLEGIIPICSYCKEIRSDENGAVWEQLEAYVRSHSNAEFSHGICPSCLPAVLAEAESWKPQ
jgi:hypothetical protein